METEPLDKVSRRERDERWKRAHQSMVAERKEAFERDGASPSEAARRAKDMQEKATNRARAQAEGRG